MVEPGDVVLTSGLVAVSKADLIGEVVAVQPANYNLSFEAVVRPFVDFAHLSYVLWCCRMRSCDGLEGVP